MFILNHHTKKIFAVLALTMILVGVFGMFAHISLANHIDISRFPPDIQDRINKLGGVDQLSPATQTALERILAGDPTSPGALEALNRLLGAAESNLGDGVASGAGWLTGFLGQSGLLIWFALMYVAELVLTWILIAVAFFMNNIFYYAVVLNPINMPIVVEGWVYLRDIANGLFILIVLWIALTIIFDVEQYGGKKLLFRVIVVALLINFSLALVSVTFAFANQLALPFYNVVRRANNGDLAGLIMNQTKTHSIFNAQGESAAAGAENEKLGIDKVTNCGFNALLSPGSSTGQGCLGADSFAGSFASAYVAGFTQGANIFGLLDATISLAIGLLLLSLVIAAFIGISAILLVRIIYMVFLSITAPVAFISHVVPGGIMENIWNLWLKKLGCWAFVAPAFYFLFYIAIQILIVMSQTPISIATRRVNVIGDLLNFIPFIVFLGFLWASIAVGKWMGCTALGNVAVDWTKKLGRAAVVGTAQLAGAAVSGGASLVAGRVAGTMAGAAKGLATKGGVGAIIAGPIARRSARNIIQQKSALSEEKKQLENMTPDNIVTRLRTQMIPNASRTLAGVQKLAEEKKLNLLTDEEQRNAVILAQNIGAEKDLLIANPYLALNIARNEAITEQTDTKAFNELFKKMRGDDMLKVDFKAMGQGRSLNEQEILRRKFLKAMMSDGNINHMAKFSEALMEMSKEQRNAAFQSWQTVLDDQTNWDSIQSSDPLMYENYVRYVAGKAGKRTLGKELPAFIKEEAKRIGVEGYQEKNQQQGRRRGGGGGTGGGTANTGNPPANPPIGFGPTAQNINTPSAGGRDSITPTAESGNNPSTRDNATTLEQPTKQPLGGGGPAATIAVRQSPALQSSSSGESRHIGFIQSKQPMEKPAPATTPLKIIPSAPEPAQTEDSTLPKAVPSTPPPAHLTPNPLANASPEERATYERRSLEVGELERKKNLLKTLNKSLGKEPAADNYIKEQIEKTRDRINTLEFLLHKQGPGTVSASFITPPFSEHQKLFNIQTAIAHLRNEIKTQEQHIYKKYGDEPAAIPQHEQKMLQTLYANYNSLIEEYRPTAE